MSTIRDTIRDAQDTLARIGQRVEYITLVIKTFDDGNRVVVQPYPGVSYPQSLGELCLDIYAKEISYGGPVGGGEYKGQWLYEWRMPGYIIHDFDYVQNDHKAMISLRRLMYHEIPAMWRRSI